MPGRRLVCLGCGIDTINPRLPIRVAGVPGGMKFGKLTNPRLPVRVAGVPGGVKLGELGGR